MPTLRVLTYNVRSMRDDADALARVIVSVAADVVLVQECPRFLFWRSRCRRLARDSELVLVTGGRPAAANLVLAQPDLAVESTHDLRFTPDPGLHRRGAAVAVLVKSGRRFAVAGTHLDLTAGPRLRHVAELDVALAAAVPPEVPTVVAADVNDRPGSQTWSALTEHRLDAFAVAGTGRAGTYPTIRPSRTIDGIFVGAGLTVRTALVVDHPDVGRASDHRPLLAELEL